MKEKIYFTKVQFNECGHRWKSTLLLNLVEGTLAYQVYDFKIKDYPPAITGIKTEEYRGHLWEEKINIPAIRMRNGKTNFKPVLLKKEMIEKKVKFSYTHKFTEKELENLLQYCNALDFEPYRGREMSMQDEGYCGYRDEIDMSFTAISNSYIPKLELPMDYYYDEKHIWPSEKLYRYVIKNFMSDKKLRYWVTSYGGLSLIF